MRRLDDSRSNLRDDFDELGDLLEQQVANSSEEAKPPRSDVSTGSLAPDAPRPAPEDTAPVLPAQNAVQGERSNGTSSWSYLGRSTFRDARGRTAKRMQFFIREDQHAAIAVLSALNTALGRTSSDVVTTTFDLLGLNGTLGVSGLADPVGVAVPDRLIDERQWEELQEAAAALSGISGADMRALSGADREAQAARYWCTVAYLVREALYDAGYGDRRRRCSTPPSWPPSSRTS